MHELNGVEIIARGVCVVDGQLLLCHARGKQLAYLPGGHVEFRETARQALAREIEEEMGLAAEVGAFLGCCEHAFVQKGEPHAEINLVFALRIPALPRPPSQPRASEDWIEFDWHPLATLATSVLEPEPLRTLLGEWLQNPGGHVISGQAWATPEHHTEPRNARP